MPKTINKYFMLAMMAIIAISSKAYTNYYITKFGDNFTTISQKTGVPVDSLIRYNPYLNGNNILEGSVIRIHGGELKAPGIKNENLIDSISHGIRGNVYTGEHASPQTVVVMLPFGSTGSLNRRNQLATEFYKGLLLSINKNQRMVDIPPTRIVAIDTDGRINDAVNDLKLLNPDSNTIVIPADDEQLINALSEMSSQNDMLILNVLSIQNNTYLENPNIIQCNINQALMYDHAINFLLSELADYTPVILKPKDGPTEKSAFVNRLKERYAAKNLTVTEIAYGRKLTDNDLRYLSPKNKYVFIPMSGSEDAFETFNTVVGKKIDNAIDKEYVLFGYPDWVTFDGDDEEALHNMRAIIYSRFFIDDEDIFVKEVYDDFTNWYGAPAVKSIPTQALLGYDTGNMLLRMLRKKWFDKGIDKFANGTYSGLQSSFRFTRENNCKGLVNNALYIIEYRPGNTFLERVF